MSPHGGPRENAGRPRLDPDVQKPRRPTIALPPDLLQFAQDLGDGNVSEGVRRALVFTREAVEMDLRVALDRSKESE